MSDAVDAFVAAAKAGTKPMLGTSSQPPPRPSSGRLIFALDATASRQPTWDMATGITCEMLREAGGLEAQLCYFRGADEFRAFDWVSDSARLVRFMGSIRCQSGPTQIGKVLAHALTETEKRKVGALVFVGDALERIYDDPESLCSLARSCGATRTSVFMFQKLTTPKSRASSATSHRSQAAHTRASSSAQRRSWRPCSKPSPPTPRAELRRLRTGETKRQGCC
jgi:hypothetical protein